MSELQLARDGAPRKRIKPRVKNTKQQRAAERARRLAKAEYLPPNDFAVRAGISRPTVWRMMQRGELRYARFGRARRIPISELGRLTTTI
jgi:excisionase family DNA binding protein